MAKHQLFLEFPITTNKGVLRIEDTSIYNSLIPVDCPTLEITPPGYSTPTVITGLVKGFDLTLTACDLGIVLTGCDIACPTIEDGIYNIRYSVSPNNKVWVEYTILRTTCIMDKWYKALCWVNDKPCTPTNDVLILIRELQLIKNQIESAKGFIEDLEDYKTGMDMFIYAGKKLTEISRGCHCC